jgi:hypothetical protein
LDHSPGTTPALRLGPGAADPGPTLLLDEDPFPEVPSLLGAAGPVAGVAGVAVGRDIFPGSRYGLVADFEFLDLPREYRSLYVDRSSPNGVQLVLQLFRYGMVY